MLRFLGRICTEMNRLAGRSLRILGVVIVLICAVLAGGTIYARNQARTLIGEFRSLDSAADPSAAALALMAKYDKHLVGKSCNSDWCQYLFVFSNASISKFRVVPRAEIGAYVTLNRGSLAIVRVEYTSAVFRADSPIVGVQEGFCPVRSIEGCDYFYLNPHGQNVAQTWNGDVGFGQRATRDQKRAAWALNADCFTALTGCKDISELLPTVWKRTSPGAVSSRLRSMADSLADAAQPLPE